MKHNLWKKHKMFACIFFTYRGLGRQTCSYPELTSKAINHLDKRTEPFDGGSAYRKASTLIRKHNKEE
jgi:hypothetical protein